MKISLNNSFIFLLITVGFQECQCTAKLPRDATLIGYIQMASPKVIKEKDIELIVPNIDEASTTRDLTTNALSVVFSPQTNQYTNASLVPNTRSILLRLRGGQNFPKAKPIIFIPLLTSGTFLLKSAETSTSGTEILVEATGSEVDMDLLCSFLISPGGIQGVASFPDVTSSTIIRASFFNSHYKLLKLYSVNKGQKTDIYIESLVELPVQFKGVDYFMNGVKYNIKDSRIIPSWGFIKVQLPHKFESNDWENMNVYTSLRTGTNKQFKQFTSKPQENEKD